MKNALDFILFIKNDVESHGYSIKIIDAKFIDTGDNAPSSGYFSEENKELVACLKSASFIEILAHEYCHFRQTIENKRLWDHSEICYNNIFEWLDGKRIKNIDKNRENYLIYLNSYIEKLDKISSSSDFKKRIDNEEFFKKIYKQKQYWELIK